MILHGPSVPGLLRDECLADLLAATAHRHPARVALRSDSRTVSYGELYAEACRLARVLRDLGARPGAIVGLRLARGADLLIAQAAITCAGAAWLPFDADTPDDRVAVCLSDAGASCWIGEAAVAAVPVPCHTLAKLRALAPRDAASAVHAPCAPQSPAYVIYTSGSTGTPKGIVVSQRSICHFLRSENHLLGVRESDVVYQGFSAAFDMSFEEIWISYLVGAALWVAPKVVIADAEALPGLMETAGVTVLHAVPTLVALFPRLPKTLRLLNLGGEACPDALAAALTGRGVRVFNTYGPTETTVSATLAELAPGAPVTIGTPLPGYGLYVRGDDGAVLPLGVAGELCVFGPGVATGYLGRPQMTAQKFLDTTPAGVGRVYRTGDLASVGADGAVRFLGRADDQVKIRGFRVELGEIEAALTRQPGVSACAVLLLREGDADRLVAYCAGDPPVPARELREALSRELPAYMVPSAFVYPPEWPRLPSGKIDRARLRAMPTPETVAVSDTPATPGGEALFAALRALFPGQALRPEQDFFDDLGGHSLLAARIVSRLRADARYATFAVGTVYARRRLGALAEALDAAAVTPVRVCAARSVRPPAWRRWACGAAQAAALPVLITARMAQWLAPFFTYHYLTGEEHDSMAYAIAGAVGVYVVMLALAFAVSVIARRVFGAGLRAGAYPLWGATYFRWWLCGRFADIAPEYLLAGSSLYPWYLRALGARVGRGVLLGSMSVRVPALLRVGDGANVGSGVNLENARVVGDRLILGAVDIGEDAVVDAYAVVEGDVRIGVGATLGPMGALASGGCIGAGEVWEGAPARCVRKARTKAGVAPGVLRQWGEALFYTVAAAVISVVFFLPVFPGFMLIDAIDAEWLDLFESGAHPAAGLGVYFVLSIPASAVLVASTLVIAAVLRALTVPSLRGGVWPVHGAVYYRKWITNQIQESALHTLYGLFATVYAPGWFRLLGAKVGANAEISTVMGVTPELLTLGDDSFVADGVMLGDERAEGGTISVRPVVLGARSFLGNGACVPEGTRIPPDVLIGVQTLAPANEWLASGQTWMGSPPAALPARETVGGFPEHLTFRPSAWRRLGRGYIEGLRIVLPMAFVISCGYVSVMEAMPAADAGEWGEFALTLGACGCVYGVASFLLVWGAKWLLIGRYRPCSAPMWTLFVWVSEAVTNLYESLAVPNFLGFLQGTPWLPVALRMMGCRIGREVYLDTTDVTEFDCVAIGDGAVLNGWCGPQTHLFEDRIMKIGRVRIGADAQVGPRCTVLYDAEVGDGARLGPLTLVAKGERIPADTAWTGSPAQPDFSR